MVRLGTSDPLETPVSKSRPSMTSLKAQGKSIDCKRNVPEMFPHFALEWWWWVLFRDGFG